MRKLYIDIKKNDELLSLESYNATLVGNGFTPTSPTINNRNSLRGLKQIIDPNYDFNPDNVFLQFKIESLDHNRTDLLLRKFIGDFINFDFRLSSQNYWRTFLQTSLEVKWIDYERLVIVTLNGESYCWGNEKFSKVINNNQSIFIDTPRPTPIKFEITALKKISNIKINDITIINLAKGETMVIDAYNCTVTVNGNNAISRVNIYDFPLAKGGYTITCDSLENIDLTIKWRARL